MADKKSKTKRITKWAGKNPLPAFLVLVGIVVFIAVFISLIEKAIIAGILILIVAVFGSMIVKAATGKYRSPS